MILIIYKHFVAFDKSSFLRKMQAQCKNQHWYEIQKFIDPDHTQFKVAFHIKAFNELILQTMLSMLWLELPQDY